ncbi:MAG: hypothetical protein ACYDH6_16460 [Acidimicrobiales bacterium]
MYGGRAVRRLQARVSWHSRVRARDWWRRHLFSVTTLGVVSLAVLGTDMFLLTQRNVTKPVTFGAALQHFRETRVLTAGPAAVTTGGVAAASTASTSSATPVPSPTATNAVGSARSAGAVVAARPVAFGLPPEGVYSYKTSGGEKINVLDASHSYPPVTYATVRHKAGCVWQIENDVIQEHTDSRDLCSARGQFSELAQTRRVTFFGKTDGGTYTCTPQLDLVLVPEPAGTARDGVCADGKGSAARIHATDLGSQQVVVGGVAVTVVHTVLDSELSGRAVGTAHDDLLIVADTGMTVAWTRSVDTVADAAFGAKAHYTEQAQFQLLSLTPQT